MANWKDIETNRADLVQSELTLPGGRLLKSLQWFPVAAPPPPPSPPPPEPTPEPEPTPVPPPPAPSPVGQGRVVEHPLGRTYVPESASAGLRSVCLWGRNGAEFTAYSSWSTTPELEAWRAWAELERVALVGLYSGGSIQTAAEFAAELARIPVAGIAAAPWLLRGFSFSGMRAWNMTTQAPERVAAFSWDSGDPLQDGWSRTWSGETVPPTVALWPQYQGKWDSFYTPPAAALRVPGLLTIGGAEQLYRKSIDFMWRLPSADGSPKPWARQEVPGRGHQYTDNGQLERELFSRALAGGVIPSPAPEPTPGPAPGPIPAPVPPTGHRLFVRGADIIDTRTGQRFLGRGVNIPCTLGCNACTALSPEAQLAEWKRRLDLAKSWGANWIRLDLESVSRAGDANIKAMVEYASGMDIVVLLTLFSDPTFSALGHPTDATLPVYRRLVAAIGDAKHVIMGLCNEPKYNYDGAQTASLRAIFERGIAAIRESGFAGPIAVQGHTGWARGVEQWAAQPFADGQVVYETHIYSGVSTFETQAWRHVAKIPLFIGEFGPINEGADMTLADCDELIKQADARQVAWAGWTFHHRCGGTLGGGTAHESGDSSMLLNVPDCGAGTALQPSAWGNVIRAALARDLVSR